MVPIISGSKDLLYFLSQHEMHRSKWMPDAVEQSPHTTWQEAVYELRVTPETYI